MSALLLASCANAGQFNAQGTQGTTVGSKRMIRLYDSIETIYKKADLVIRGKVLRSRLEWMIHDLTPDSNSPKEPTTIFTVEITGVYKGSTEKKTMEVMQLSEGTETASSGIPHLTTNAEYVLFLTIYEKQKDRTWLIGNGLQSIYLVQGNDLGASSFGFALTFDDLDRFAKTQ
jgi:hypothetical protein